ncbi:hypothetical protein HRI_002101700 [Hibiscus trionum]|uniref:G protein gamma domain-containing protein n=1 Tax=Hibiscus trionum TaxID=183268 RepID=A0A9W7HVD9_HIBTR|nr:hypothetical protein HRI_002101700 [Hibiscus trionum]
MAVRSGGSSSSVRSLPPPCPKSPPEYPDLYGKRRETAKIQMLEREISVLEEELKSVEGLQPASRYCKEVMEFVMAKSDPLIPTSRKNRKSCRFWKWLCAIPCFNLSWICCCCSSGCSCQLKCLQCCDGGLCNCSSCICDLCKCRPFHVNVARATPVCVNAVPATAVPVSAAARVTAVHVSAARSNAVHVQAAAQSQNVDANASHATVVHVQAAAQSRNVDASAAVHVQAAAQSQNGTVSRVLNPVASERSHAAAGTVAYFDSLHAQIAFAANANVQLLNVQR